METQFGELNVFANRDTPTPPVDETGTVHLSFYYKDGVRSKILDGKLLSSHVKKSSKF